MQHDLSPQKIAPSGKGDKTGNKTIAMESGRSFYRRLFFIHWRKITFIFTIKIPFPDPTTFTISNCFEVIILIV